MVGIRTKKHKKRYKGDFLFSDEEQQTQASIKAYLKHWLREKAHGSSCWTKERLLEEFLFPKISEEEAHTNPKAKKHLEMIGEWKQQEFHNSTGTVLTIQELVGNFLPSIANLMGFQIKNTAGIPVITHMTNMMSSSSKNEFISSLRTLCNTSNDKEKETVLPKFASTTDYCAHHTAAVEAEMEEYRATMNTSTFVDIISAVRQQTGSLITVADAYCDLLTDVSGMNIKLTATIDGVKYKADLGYNANELYVPKCSLTMNPGEQKQILLEFRQTAVALQRCLNFLKDFDEEKHKILSAIMCNDPLKNITLSNWELRCTIDGYISSISTQLNFKQMAALMSWRDNLITIIHGPPGTGKTYVIATILQLSENLNAKALATAPSNAAVSKIVEALAEKALKPVWIVAKSAWEKVPATLTQYTLQHK